MATNPLKPSKIKLNTPNLNFNQEFFPNDSNKRPSSKKKEKKEKGYEKYRTNSFVSQLNYYINKFRFAENELLMIKKRFNKMCLKGVITKMKFRESLGVLGLENASYLADRVFSIIDLDNDGVVSFEEFVNYMNVLIKGDENEKALLSFRILDTGHKGRIIYEDIEKMLFGICLLWNSITGSKIMPKKQYIDYIFKSLDVKGNNEILFKDFLTVYKAEPELYCWFEFLNQGELEEESLGDKKALFLKKEEHKNSEIPSLSHIHETNTELLHKNLSDIEREISNCVSVIKEEEKRLKNKKKNSPFVSPRKPYHSPVSFSKIMLSNCSPLSNDNYTTGPSFFNTPMETKQGDFSPNDSFEKIEEKSNEDDSLDNMKISHENKFHSHLLDTLNGLTKLAENIKQEINKNSPNYLNASKTSLDNSVDRTPKALTLVNNSNIKGTSKFNKLSGSHNVSLSSQNIGSLRRITVRNMPGTPKKKAKTKTTNLGIYFGHENWNLVLNMIIGIRTSIKSLYSVCEDNPVETYEFSMKGHFELIQKRVAGFDMRKASKFFDYAPSIFERIRKKFGISNEMYLRSIGPENLLGSIIMGNLASLTELMSSGKSGSFFYFTGDCNVSPYLKLIIPFLKARFMLKTVSKAEFVLMRKVLQSYFRHIIDNEHTLMTKIYGLHKIKLFKSKNQSEKLYFLIMANLFMTPLEIDVRYDLKGSQYGRSSRKPNKPWDKSIALKDLDFIDDGISINLNSEDREMMIKQLERDVGFFQINHINDYSLLVGIHTITPESKQFFALPNFVEAKTQKHFYEAFQGGMLSKDKKKIYFIGVIDILTEFVMKKKMEYGFKKTFLGKGISCIPPYDYGNRFLEFMKEHVFL